MQNGWSSTEYGHPTWTAHVLILTRRLGQSLVFGPSIRVTVVGIRGNQVRIGIEAPKSVRVHREELYERMQRDQQAPREPKATPIGTSERTLNTLERHSRHQAFRELQTRHR
jgi:carbon storage regulator